MKREIKPISNVMTVASFLRIEIVKSFGTISAKRFMNWLFKVQSLLLSQKNYGKMILWQNNFKLQFAEKMYT